MVKKSWLRNKMEWKEKKSTPKFRERTGELALGQLGQDGPLPRGELRGRRKEPK